MAVNFEDLVLNLNNKGFKISKRGELTRNNEVEYATVFNNQEIELVVGLDKENLSELKVFTLIPKGYGKHISLYKLGVKTLEDVILFINNNEELLRLEFDNTNISKQIKDLVGREDVEISYGSDGISYTGFISEETIDFNISEFLYWKTTENKVLEHIDLYLAYELNESYNNLTSVEDKQEFLEEVQKYLRRAEREDSLEEILEDIINYGEEINSVDSALKHVFNVPKLPEEYENGIKNEEPKELAAKVRKRLKKQFPNTKFKVISSYSGGLRVSVEWEGYPIKSVVEEDLAVYNPPNSARYGYVDPEDGKVYSGVQYFRVDHEAGDKLSKLYYLIHESRHLGMGNLTYEDYTEYKRGRLTLYRNSLNYESRLKEVLDENSFNQLYKEYVEIFRERFNAKLRETITRGFGNIVEFSDKDYSRLINLDNEDLTVKVKLTEYMLPQEIESFKQAINNTPFMKAYNLKVVVNEGNDIGYKKGIGEKRLFQNALKASNKDKKDNVRLHRLISLLLSKDYKVKPERAEGCADRIEVTVGKIKIKVSPMYMSIDDKLIYYKNREGDDYRTLRSRIVLAVKDYTITEDIRRQLMGIAILYEHANDLRKKV